MKKYPHANGHEYLYSLVFVHEYLYSQLYFQILIAHNKECDEKNFEGKRYDPTKIVKENKIPVWKHTFYTIYTSQKKSTIFNALSLKGDQVCENKCMLWKQALRIEFISSFLTCTF